MKFISKLDFSQKSIFGFKILSSLQSTISCYILLFIGKNLNLLFGNSKINIIAGSLFNIVLNSSVVILIINLIIKRKRKAVKNFLFYFLNFILFIYIPFAFYDIFRYAKILFISNYNYQTTLT